MLINTHKDFLTKLPSELFEQTRWALSSPTALASSISWLVLSDKGTSTWSILFFGAIFKPSCLSLLETWTGETLQSGSRASAMRRLQCLSSLNLKQQYLSKWMPCKLFQKLLNKIRIDSIKPCKHNLYN